MHKDTLPLLINQADQISAVKANDDKVLKALYQDNYHKAESYVLNNNGSTAQARDIYQEAFIAVWRNIQLDKFKPENESSLAGYIYQVAKNKWLDYLRSGHHTKIIPIDNTYIELEQAEALAEEENEYVLSVKNNFRRLGENCRQVLVKFYYHKEPLKIIAKTFNWTEATARNTKYRCLQRLRALIKK